MSERNEVKCPRDGNTLVLMYEAEKLGSSARIVLYYKCPLCNYKRDIERLELRKADQGVIVKRFLCPQ